jgi:hypothetical protein
VRLEARTKAHVHNLIHEFLIKMAFIMACPNFKKGLEMVFEPLGVKLVNLSVDQNYLTKSSSNKNIVLGSKPY